MGKAGNEIVIAVVGALGTDLKMVQLAIEKALDEVGYSAVPIRLSELISDVPGFRLSADCMSESYDIRVNALMDAGNGIRSKLGGDALAKLAVTKIRDIRDQANSGKSLSGNEHEESSLPLLRTAYILRSLKHPEEVDLLRSIYGDSFFLFAAFCPKSIRVQKLAHWIRGSRHRHRADEFEPIAMKLLQKDEEEPDNKMGQQVRKTFWLGDAFVDATDKDQASAQILRTVRSWFGHPYITPTRDEFSMFCARAASFQSASMGRQVGAAISDANGAVVATGTNEIPKYGGGHYWEGDEPDGRDHRRGYESSDTMILELLEDALARLLDIGWRAPSELEEKSIREKTQHLLSHEKMEGAEFNSLMEYMRPVHAEMSAISDAARRGISVEGLSLFCTTFPCHSCARHIVAVGISRVVYIEPYAKSLVRTLYSDSISVDDSSCSGSRVVFEPFIGIAPRRYLSFFKMGKRKESGLAVSWVPSVADPKIGEWEDWLSIEKENRMLEEFRRLIQDTNWDTIYNGNENESTNENA